MAKWTSLAGLPAGMAVMKAGLTITKKTRSNVNPEKSRCAESAAVKEAGEFAENAVETTPMWNGRCQAYDGKQCRRTKNLTQTIVTIHREESFIAKLPEHAVIALCPEHLKLAPFERFVLAGNRAGFEKTEAG
jgi:RNA polymerase subunit RPABC4/transcription elongation factor Spt4